MTTNPASVNTHTPDPVLEAEVAEMIVAELNLDMAPSEIDPTKPLYGDGLGLDSIDILEIALVVSKKYGVQIKADNADNYHIFASLRNLASHIAQHRTQ